MSKWRLINYFDVWGNDEDGYEVNDVSVESEDLNIMDDASYEEVFNYLRDDIGFFGPEAKYEDMNMFGDDSAIEIMVEHNSFPLCRLERMV